MKRFFAVILTLCLALALFACGIKKFNAAADFPEGVSFLTVKEIGKQGDDYYAVVDPADADDETLLTFRLAADFAAQAFEPGVDGAVYMLDYNSPQDFYSQWYLQAKKYDDLGALFAFGFEGDELASLHDTTGFSPPDGPPMEGASLPDGVKYIEAFELQSDPGDNMSAEGGAKALFSAIIYEYPDLYTPGDAVTITLTGLDTVDGQDAYLYTIQMPDSESKHAVNYAGDVYVLLDGEYKIIYGGGREALVTDAKQAEAVLDDAIRDLTQAMAATGNIALVAKGEDTVNGQRAWLFSLGKDGPHAFAAEYHFAVTESGEVLVMDAVNGGDYAPWAVG